MRLPIENVSRGGAAFRSGGSGVVDDPVQFALPGLLVRIDAHAVRIRDSLVALAFRQDEQMLAAVATALAVLAGEQAMAA